MSKTGPQSIIQRQAKVQELVERLAELPHDLSGPLVKTLLPIIKLIPTVRDKLIMALRKATFSRYLNCCLTYGRYDFILYILGTLSNVKFLLSGSCRS